jgi:hypothetical protein
MKKASPSIESDAPSMRDSDDPLLIYHCFKADLPLIHRWFAQILRPRSMTRFLPVLTVSGLLLCSLFLLPNEADAQIALSPRGSVSQTIDGTTIDVEYSRPRLRGRTGMFGGPIWWGHIWTPGADWATIIEVNNDITLSGTEIPAGKYSIWMVVTETGDWEVILDPEWKQFHLPEPQKNGDEITFWVTPNREAPVEETLTWEFVDNTNSGTKLRLHFETHEVILPIEVPSRLQMFVTQEEAAPYVGTYAMQVNEYVWTPRPFQYEMRMWFESDQLRFNMQLSPDDPNFMFQTGMLPLPQARGIYYVAFLEDGEVFQTLDDMVEFVYDDSGAVSGFELRAEDDTLWMVGTRVSE